MLTWVLSTVGISGVLSVCTYIFTIRSTAKKAKAEAKSQEIKTLHEQLDLNLDMCDYLQKVTDKYIHDYHELEANLRKLVSRLHEQIEELAEEKSKIIAAKCNEIAELQSKVSYLEGVSCYDFTCGKRKQTK